MIKLAHFSFFFMAEDYGGSVPGLQLKPTSPLVPQILSFLKLGNYSKNFSFSPTSSFSPVQWIILISIQICDYFFLFRKSKAKQTNKQTAFLQRSLPLSDHSVSLLFFKKETKSFPYTFQFPSTHSLLYPLHKAFVRTTLLRLPLLRSPRTSTLLIPMVTSWSSFYLTNKQHLTLLSILFSLMFFVTRFSGSILYWFSSFLTSQFFMDSFAGFFLGTNIARCKCSSIPRLRSQIILFSTCVHCLYNLIQFHNFKHHLFTDHSQLISLALTSTLNSRLSIWLSMQHSTQMSAVYIKLSK